MRRKKKITVIFIVSQLSYWKTESLYVAMANNSRFAPLILLLPTPDREDDFHRAIKYMACNQYDFDTMAEGEKIWNKYHPDIIFYQQPYWGVINPQYDYLRNLHSLFCYVHYAFHTLDDVYLTDQPMCNFCWQLYFENELTKSITAPLMYNKATNVIATGLPNLDSYFCQSIIDPWKCPRDKKKRIIWAPHHSLPESGHLCFSTFLIYADLMLDFAERYKDQVYFSFKPHPALKYKLYRIWGQEKTDHYYQKWEIGENSQMDLGGYVDLFKMSDAMIHDSLSFTVEYLYVNKPVMMLSNGNRYTDANEFEKMALANHYWGTAAEDIEEFICNVIFLSFSIFCTKKSASRPWAWRDVRGDAWSA